MVAPKRKPRSRQRRKPTFFGWLLRLFSFLILVGGLITIISSFIPPDKFWVPAFFSLAFPVFFSANAILIIVWVLRRRWFALLHLSLLILFIPLASRHIQLRNNLSVNHKFASSIISYNVRALIGNDGKSNITGLMNLIKNENPYILCLQEYRDDWWNKDDNTSKILKLGHFQDYVFQSYFPVKSNRKAMGIALFSQYPIIAKSELRAGSRLIAVFADLLITGDTIRVFSMHLQSNAFQKEDYELVEGLMEPGKPINSDLEVNSRKLAWKMRKAFIKRAYQARLINEAIQQSPFPVIVCGDMNDTPASYAYRKVRGSLQDAFQKAGHGLGNTYLGNLPKIRIDYIFMDQRFKCLDFDILPYHFSDHYPVRSRFYLKKYSFAE